MNHGTFNLKKTIEYQGIRDLNNVFYNLMEPGLIQEAIQRGEGELGNGGTLLVTTGKHSGRSPNDKFIVKTASNENSVWWENNCLLYTSDAADE